MTLLQISEPEFNEDKIKNKKLSIGIDLGTTNSLVAFINDKSKPEIIFDYNNNFLVPSVVHYENKDSVVVGSAALKLINDKDTVSSFKRFMGRSFKDVNKISDYHEFIDDCDVLKIRTSFGNFTPIEFSAHILEYIKKLVENRFHSEIDGAVITVPAYFDEKQRQATRDAANLAGLKVIRLLNEPTAAAIAYGLEKSADGIHIVFDLGGGTFDVSILKLQSGIFDVISTYGNTNLGGNDFDKLIADYICNYFSELSISIADKRKILIEARSIRECLTDNVVCNFNIELTSRCVLNGVIDRYKFLEISRPLLNDIRACVNQALKDSKINIRSDIFSIIMVGGATRMPIIRELVIDIFGKEPLSDIDPDKVVSIGAALQADMLLNSNNEKWLLLDVTPLSLGIETMGGLFEKIIPRNSRIPIVVKQEFTTIKNNQKSMIIHVLQGESSLVSECRSLASFELNNIPLMPAGIPRIEVTFQIDADGLLQVEAREITTNLRSSIEIKPSNGLTVDKIRSMINRDIYNSDSRDILLVETKLELKKTIAIIEDAISKDYQLLSNEELLEIQDHLGVAKKNVDNSDTDYLKKILNELYSITESFAISRMNNAIKEALYKKNISDV